MSHKYITLKEKKSIESWASKLKKEKILSYSRKKALVKLNLPYKCIGSGKHRIVFDIGNGHVLKVARVKKGIKCNKNEVVLYKRVTSSLRKHLSKIVDHGYGWVVMKKITKKMPRGSNDYKKKAYKVYRKFKDHGMKINDNIYKNSRSPNRANVRISKHGRVVLIDYANSSK